MTDYPLGARIIIGGAFILLGISMIVFRKWNVDETNKFWKNIYKPSEWESKLHYILLILGGIAFVLGGTLMIVRPDLFT